MQAKAGIHDLLAACSKVVDGGPAPAMTMGRGRRVNHQAGWYHSFRGWYQSHADMGGCTGAIKDRQESFPCRDAFDDRRGKLRSFMPCW